MTSIQNAQRRLESANTVPSPNSLPDGMWSSAELLERIHQRRDAVTDTMSPMQKTEPPEPPNRRRGPLVALAAAAAVIVLGVVIALTGGSDPEPPATTLPPSTTTTEAVTTTTTTTTEATTPTTLAPAAPLDVLGALYTGFRAADADAYFSVFAPEVTVCPDGVCGDITFVPDPSVNDGAARLIRGARWLDVSGGRLDTTCELTSPTQVVCNEAYWSGFGGDEPIQTSTDNFVVEDGQIVRLWQGESKAPSYMASEEANIVTYGQWLETTHPEDHLSLFVDDVTPALDTAEQRELHRQYITEYVLSTLASADPLEVVDVLYTAFRAADAERYFAVFAPEVTVCPNGVCGDITFVPDPSVNEAAGRLILGARWLEASGGRLDTTCELMPPNQVVCDEQYWSGFGGDEPIQTSTDNFVVEDGQIVRLWQGESKAPSYMASEEANIVAYGQWLETNHPEDHLSLFADSTTVVLDTAEQRDLHRQYIAEYLATLS